MIVVATSVVGGVACYYCTGTRYCCIAAAAAEMPLDWVDKIPDYVVRFVDMPAALVDMGSLNIVVAVVVVVDGAVVVVVVVNIRTHSKHYSVVVATSVTVPLADNFVCCCHIVVGAVVGGVVGAAAAAAVDVGTEERVE